MLDILHRTVNYQYSTPARHSRESRYALFLSLLAKLPRPLRILDVGGMEEFWRILGMPKDVEVTLLNIVGQPVSMDHMQSMYGDARDLSGFADQSFDVVFSNSTLEHVGVLEDMTRMAKEVRRVGRAFFVQTPNFWFPIEPHYLCPGLHFLPLGLRAWLICHLHLSRNPFQKTWAEAKAEADSVHLITRQVLLSLFPGATLWVDRWYGIPKSLVVYDGFERRPCTS